MKLPWLFIVTIFILLGCNENTSDDEFTIEDIVNKSIEVMEAVDSYTFEMDSQQIMNLTDTEHVNLYSQLKMDLVTVPLTFYQQTSINSELLGETVYYQTYYSEEEGLFMEDPFSNDWAKYPEVLVTEILNDSEEHIHPKGQLVPLLMYTSEISLNSENDTYILHLSGKGKTLEDLAEHLLSMSSNNMDEIFQILSNLEILELDYMVFIDKESFHLIKSSIKIVMDMEILDERIQSVLTTQVRMGKFNEVINLVIPEDIIKNAVELSEEEIFGR